MSTPSAKLIVPAALAALVIFLGAGALVLSAGQAEDPSSSEGGSRHEQEEEKKGATPPEAPPDPFSEEEGVVPSPPEADEEARSGELRARDPGVGGGASTGEETRGSQKEAAPDPLGVREKNERSGVTTGQRVAASEYVAAAFGYTGDDANAYYSKLSEHADLDSFEKSPGYGPVEQTVSLLDRGRTVRQAAVLEEFEGAGNEESASSGSGEEEEEEEEEAARIVFAQGEGYGWTDSGLEGEVTRYEQEILLSPKKKSGAKKGPSAWTVRSAGAVRPLAAKAPPAPSDEGGS